MNTLSARPLLRTLGALLLGIAVAGAPALSYAQHSGGGGGGGRGGGGGGGGHGGGGGGGHFGGGGGGHFSGGGQFSGGHYGGYSGSHYMSHGGAFVGGYAAGAHYYAGARSYGGAHGYTGAHTYGGAHYGAGYASGHFSGGRVFYPGRGYYPGRYWGGGYWRGVFWPHCYFYPGFAWYLPFLPFGYATFWWGGLPYYYVNDLYYTYSPSDNGYVVTEPPPVAGEVPDQSGSAAAPAGAAGDVYVYPRNGQSDQQTANDRYECHSWAVGQTGFDPTRGGQQSGNPDDYRRAMVSCLDARGYSAR